MQCINLKKKRLKIFKHIMLPNQNRYTRRSYEAKYLSFSIKNYNKICNKIRNSINKKFDINSTYNEKYKIN